jgi:hypothetical protein
MYSMRQTRCEAIFAGFSRLAGNESSAALAKLAIAEGDGSMVRVAAVHIRVASEGSLMFLPGVKQAACSQRPEGCSMIRIPVSLYSVLAASCAPVAGGIR